MEELAVIVVRGLGLGAVFALVAMNLNAVHRASGIFNFAQGAMMVLGGIIAARYMPNVPTRIDACSFCRSPRSRSRRS